MSLRKIRLKSPDDLKRIREGGAIISDIFRTISEMALQGISTWEIDTFIDGIIVKRGARSAFKTIQNYDFASCISINNEVVHGVPSKKKRVKEGDIVKIDIGIALNGYFSDSCWTFTVGKISDDARRLVASAGEALERAIGVMAPGNFTGDLGHVVETYARERGYSVVKQFTGHGTGFALHEPPQVPHYGRPGTGVLLAEGMVLAVEPVLNKGRAEVKVLDDGWTAVTADGLLSAQFEHTVAITSRGPIILTA